MRIAFMIASMLVCAPAMAEERDFCASRPGLDTPPCIANVGRPVFELGITDWTLDRQADSRTDTLATGQALVRIGLADSTEVQIGWTAYGHVRTRDRASGATTRVGGIGDVTLALRRSLGPANGPIAIQPYVTLPTGGDAIGTGDWSAGVLLPIALPLGKGVQLALTPQVAAAVDSDGAGRHLAFGSAIGISTPLTPSLSGAIEASVARDDDPTGASTTALASASLACMVAPNTQLDVGSVAGLNAASPDIELYIGISRRF